MRRMLLLAILTLLCGTSPSGAQTSATAFTYQGRLQQANAPQTGLFDFQFTLHSFDTGGVTDAPILQQLNVPVQGGLFTVTLDFGAAFIGSNRFLEIAVRPAGSPTFTTLSPRQPITAAPAATSVGNLFFQPGSSQVDQQQTDRDQAIVFNSSVTIIQTFTPVVSGDLVALDLAVSANTLQRYKIDIFDGPTLIGTGTVFTGFAGEFQTVSLSTPAPLNATQLYTIRLTTTSSNLSARKSGASNPYLPGTLSVNGVVQTGDLSFLTRMGHAQELFTPGPMTLSSSTSTPSLRIRSFGSIELGRGGAFLIGNELAANLVFNAGDIQARSAGAAADMRLNPLGGNLGIGIGTAIPNAKLHIGGTAGTDGIQFPDGTLQTTAYQRLKASIVADPPSLASGGSTTLSLTITGAAAGDVAMVSPRVALPAGIVIAQTRVNTNVVAVHLFNASGGTLDAASNTFDVIVLK